MQDKQKVTLYLSPELHRQLKIRSAVDSEPMSAIAQRAIVFYLKHPEMVDSLEEKYGKTHQVYNCPECANPVVFRDGEMVSLADRAEAILDDDMAVTQVNPASDADRESEPLVIC
ncbi:MAG: hypothetical protein SWY16_26735 [Cyanobacteriota bacterium]|nr:hypothetical protein [Cyanobacteriota bacterium]